MDKTYLYKVYRPDGTYLGVLQNVSSEFSYAQDMNSAGSSLTIQVPLNVDVGVLPITALLDETGATILDESNNPILEERAADVFGSSSIDIQLRNGNVVEVYEFSSYHPNGKKMFSGVINELEANFGSENKEEVVTALVYSRGSQLDNYIIQDGI